MKMIRWVGGPFRFFVLPALVLVSLAPALAQDAPKSSDDSWTAPLRAAGKENPVPADAKSIEQGKALFGQNCVACHGNAGKGDGPAAAMLERNGKRIHPRDLSDPKTWQQSDGALFWKISEGKTPMPTFSQLFSEEQRWTIVNYVRTLAPKPTKPN